MEHWIFYSLIATLSLGISMALYKTPAIKGYSSTLSTFWTNLFSVVIVVGGLLWSGNSLFQIQFSWFGFLWGIIFGIGMILTKNLLKQGDVSSIFPVTSSISNVLVISIGLIVLSEQLTYVQLAGVLLILFSVFFFTKKREGFPKIEPRTFFLILGILATSVISKYIQKLGAMYDPFAAFMSFQYVGAAGIALMILFFFERKDLKEVKNWKSYWKNTFLIALFSVIGGWAILKALSIGPLSGVYAIHPAYTFVSGLFGYFFFKEKLTRNKIFLIMLTILGVILIKVG